MRRGGLRDVAQALRAGSPDLPGLGVAADDGVGNQLLLDPVSPADDAAVTAAAEELLGPGDVLRATPAAKLVGIRLLEMDVDGYKEMAAFFPFFFLGVGAFIVASILARLVDAQRALVGTLAALGVGRARILGHYLAFALVLAGAGALLGALASLLVGPAMTRAYAADLGIPFVTSRVHWDLVAYGVLGALAVAFLAGLVPALHASGLPPAEAMRPPRPSAGPLTRLTRRVAGPLALRLAARDLLGRPLRSLSTALGVAAALVLVLATGGMVDSMTTTLGCHLWRRAAVRPPSRSRGSRAAQRRAGAIRPARGRRAAGRGRRLAGGAGRRGPLRPRAPARPSGGRWPAALARPRRSGGGAGPGWHRAHARAGAVARRGPRGRSPPPPPAASPRAGLPGDRLRRRRDGQDRHGSPRGPAAGARPGGRGDLGGPEGRPRGGGRAGARGLGAP